LGRTLKNEDSLSYDSLIFAPEFDPAGNPKRLELSISAVDLLLSAVHMPAGIDPLPFAKDEHFSDAAALVLPLAPELEFVRVCRIQDGSLAVDLNLGLGEL
jgi:hypothetical protein